MNTAVLVIDMQQGLCVGPGAAHDCAGTIDRINFVTRQARSAAVPVVFIQHESGPGYLEYGSLEWQLAAGLEVQPSDLRVRKTTPDAFLRTELHSLLEERQIRRLVVCGMHTEFCVDTTTRKALALGYPVVLVTDAHTSAGNQVLSPQQVIAHHNATLTNITSFGPRVQATSAKDLRLAAATLPPTSSSWAEVTQASAQLGPMLALVRSIASSPHASSLFPALADGLLWISRAPDPTRGDGALRIGFDASALEFTFTYVPRSGEQRGWSRTCTVGDGIATFERILHKRLRWLHEG